MHVDFRSATRARRFSIPAEARTPRRRYRKPAQQEARGEEVAVTKSGVIDLASNHSVSDTIDRLESLAKSNGLLVFARIDFSGDAGRAGLTMPPMQMLVFGNPKAGTPLLIQAPHSGLDLPLKALAWQDATGKVWASLNDPEYIVRRHGLSGELAQRLAGAAELARKAAE
jgi:uncharacterized protein (DUF302 family)